jgi:hypothetical protein
MKGIMMSKLEDLFREDRPFLEKLKEISFLVAKCRWVADALEKSIDSNIICEGDEVDERVENVSAALTLLLGFAADRLFDLSFDAAQKAEAATLEESA